MRVGTVSSSELAKAKRWDVAYWLGDKTILSGAEVEKAEESVRAAEKRLAAAKRRQSEEKKRVAQLVADGKVTVIES